MDEKIWRYEVQLAIISQRKEVSRLLTQVCQRGQGLLEYALIIVLVAIVVIVVLTLLGPIIGNMFTNINSSFS
jgi:pilus assembly protein Flp/PilA